VFFGIASMVLAIVYLPGIPGCVMSHTTKAGSVVDPATGRGVADAAVIATSNMTCSGGGFVESRTSTDTEYRIVAHSDEDGSYVIPSTWSDVGFVHLFGFLGACHEAWTLKPFKLGYVSSDDAKEWARETPIGVGSMSRLAVEGHPNATWLLMSARVEPIALNAHPLPVGDAARYYSSVIGSGGFPQPDQPNDDEIRMRLDAGSYFEEQLCRLNPDDEIDWGDDMRFFVSNRIGFVRQLDRMEPAAFEVSRQTGKPSVFKAKTICDAMRETLVGSASSEAFHR
jgi:hypothetical protein